MIKSFTLLSILALLSSFTFAQNKGSIIPKEPFPKAGIENVFIYQPPTNILIPDKAKASVVYINKRYFNKTVPLVKNGNSYSFSFKAPASTEAIVTAIVDESGVNIDNNRDMGYLNYLYENSNQQFPASNISAISLLTGYATYILKLNIPADSVLQWYNTIYKLHPALKKDPSYYDYLAFLYFVKKDTVKQQLLAYAKQSLSEKGEIRWRYAMNIYRLLKMEDQQKATEQKILSAYPDGEVAKENFMTKYYSDTAKTEASSLLAMRNYISRFKDSSALALNDFYSVIFSTYLQKEDWNFINKYDHLINDKVELADMYNNVAWNLSGGGLSGDVRDLDFAKTISKRSVDIIQNLMDNATNHDQDDLLVNRYIGFTDTYALLLYKQGRYDSAFYYQDAILQRGPMGVEGMERYAAYAEKSRGAIFAKQFIEPQLLKGVNSPTMQDQLLSIYKQNNLPMDEYNKIMDTANLIATAKTVARIKAQLGSDVAKDFTLKNLQGEEVSLSSLKNKVVVLDFWATWCGPCRASFPAMQEAVTKYKDDKEVAFLFIDVFENKEPKKMLAETTQFINDHKYNFQVLLDTKDEVAGDYKVNAIPARFIINKEGKIVSMGESGNDISTAIEAARK
jgi:thiol-disulfide isomerase/thioredoxin